MSQLEIWEDAFVLHYLRTQKYQEALSAVNKDKVYRRAKSFRWLTRNLYKLHKDGS